MSDDNTIDLGLRVSTEEGEVIACIEPVGAEVPRDGDHIGTAEISIRPSGDYVSVLREVREAELAELERLRRENADLLAERSS